MDAVLLLPMPEDVAEESDAFFFVLWLALLFMHVQEHFASYIQWGACTIKMMVWFILSLIAETKVVLDIFCTRPQWPAEQPDALLFWATSTIQKKTKRRK
ncbi:unnamed protein product [Heterosigma akashiwo]